MKTANRFTPKRLIPVGSLLLAAIPATALASGPEWRPMYDQLMMYVNFAILAGVIYKYGRTPIKNFLKQQKEDVVAKLDALEAEKRRVLQEIESVRVQSEENKQRLEEMKTRLIAQGRTKKQQIIEQAQQQSVIMIEETHKKMDNRIVQARNQLKMELADLAFEQAIRKLPQMINADDNQRIVEKYMQRMQVD